VGQRDAWASVSDDELLARCEVDLYRASGPGGQKRNKTSSAVRLRHLPSGLRVIAEESRSQHENKAKALKRMRRALWLELREPPPEGDLAAHPTVTAARDRNGALWVGARDPRYLPLAALLLDTLEAHGARMAETAGRFGIGSAALADLLRADEDAWKETCRIRQAHGLKALN
jgi:hypothetical protein